MALRERRTAGVTKVVPWRKRKKDGGLKVKRAGGNDFQPRKIETHDAPKAMLRVVSPVERAAGLDDRGRVTISIEDLMENTISILRNSRLSYVEIRARGGPSAGTLTKWVARETKRPQLNTIRAALDACDMDILFVPKKRR